MNKNALRFLVASALLSPATLYALGLGEIRLNSALNQPFDADIEVVSATADELLGLKVALASDDTFRRYGLDRPNFLSNFSLRVDDASSARPTIKVRSTSAVSEPFLNLLVEVSWSGGTVLREYTVLLDPPVLGPAATNPQPAQAPRASAATTAPAGAIVRTQPASTEAGNTSQTTTSARPQASPSDSYSVKAGDSLSKIVSDLNQAGSSNAQQTMLAVFRANPQAFADNVNVLRAGSVLRIPTAADIAAISSAEAAAEIGRQNGIWRNAVSPTRDAPAAERLRLVPAEQSGTVGVANAGAVSARISSLEAELAETKRLLDLKNAELARMQQQLSSGQPVGTTSEPESAATAIDSAVASSDASVTAAQAVEPTPQAESVPAATVADAQNDNSPSLLSQISKYGLWIILGAVGVIFALLAFFRRRQQQLDADNSAETFTARDFEAHLSRRTNQVVEEPTVEVDEGTGQHEALFEPEAEAVDPEPSSAASMENTLSGETAFHVDQQDALAEADFHMAYGLYDQAADIVKLAIERQPERHDLKLKLAEIFFVWGNKDSFVEVARELYDAQGQADASDWDKVLIMGKQICPDDPLFAGDLAGSSSAESVDVNLEGGEHHVDIDLYDAPEGDRSRSDLDFELGSTAEHPKIDDTGLDFLLDEPQRGVEDDDTREMDGNVRTQETPTIESPTLPGRGSVTIREKLDQRLFENTPTNADQTAELSLDEIGLNVDDLDQDGLNDEQQISDDDLTRIALADTSHDINQTKTMLAAHMNEFGEDDREKVGDTITDEEIDLDDAESLLGQDVSSTGTFRATQKIDVDFELHPTADDTVEQIQPDAERTGLFQTPSNLDVDLDHLADPQRRGVTGDTTKQMGRGSSAADEFSEDVFGNTDFADVAGLEPTNRTEVINSELDMGDIEPATMSEVGTKLDLARAYMDMGDPDGARSILDEVLEEGTAGQKQEAQRLLSSIG
ncbi:MAG: FimV/HubP family polar landmark protein [Steroidobacteraceae bacterium]